MEEIVCINFGKTVTKQKRYKDRITKYCSSKCYGEHKRKDTRMLGGYKLVINKEHPNRIGGMYVLEHRYIMEQHLNRLLEKDEDVHHINGIKTDNRIENLQLFKNNSEHIKQAHKDLGISTRFKNSNL